MTVTFVEDDGFHSGAGESGRQWRITRVKTGWRLHFRDAGDTTPVNAGVYSTLADAQAAAG